jgi:GNAT superfamily N-acetyltransferase
MALHEQKLLTQFYVEKPFLAQGQRIFQQLLQRFRPEAAFVPTCDELFLSHTLDQEAGVNKQAYFFQDCREIQVDHKLYQPGQFRLATPADRLEIEKISGDFFDHLAERITRDEIFVFREKDVLLGAGIAVKGKLLKHVASIGMFTHEQHRQKGVGRSLIIHLKKWCYENGFLPIAGCWYYNFNSKRTLESAGMVTRTRLLKINFAVAPDNSLPGSQTGV